MNGLPTLATALAVIFAVSFLALFAVLFFVLWHRRRFHRRSPSIGDSDFQRDSFYTQTKSKELLYFFCWTNQSRVEPNKAPPPPQGESPPPETDDELLKWQILYGPSRLLFTIKEEEKDELDSENGAKTRNVSIETLPEIPVTIQTEPENSVTIEVDHMTPFSTPCPSPPYFTPSSSPARASSLAITYE